tara:strand:+ start:145 stop:381 length:237 start_codon:yes stop_codon:yes gene_type:complete
MMSHPKFVYDHSVSYEDNYAVWKDMNDTERRKEEEDILSPTESRLVFDKQYSEYAVPDKYQGITSDNADYFVQEDDDG